MFGETPPVYEDPGIWIVVEEQSRAVFEEKDDRSNCTALPLHLTGPL